MAAENQIERLYSANRKLAEADMNDDEHSSLVDECEAKFIDALAMESVQNVDTTDADVFVVETENFTGYHRYDSSLGVAYDVGTYSLRGTDLELMAPCPSLHKLDDAAERVYTSSRTQRV